MEIVYIRSNISFSWFLPGDLALFVLSNEIVTGAQQESSLLDNVK